MLNKPTTTNILAVSTLVVEILELVDKELANSNPTQAAEYLNKCRGANVVKGYLDMNFNPDIKFNLPEGKTPAKINEDVPEGYGLTNLREEFRRMYIFTNQQSNLPKSKRENLWIQMLEGLNHREAKLLDLIKDKQLNSMFPHITADFLRTVYPDLNLVQPNVTIDTIVAETEQTIQDMGASILGILEESSEADRLVESMKSADAVEVTPLVDTLNKLQEFNTEANKVAAQLDAITTQCEEATNKKPDPELPKGVSPIEIKTFLKQQRELKESDKFLLEEIFCDVEPEIINKLTPAERLSLYNALINFEQDGRWYDSGTLANPDQDDLIGSFGRDMTALLDIYEEAAIQAEEPETAMFFNKMNALYSVSKKLN